jgi:hypothetical protein
MIAEPLVAVRCAVCRVPASRRDVGRVPASRRDVGGSEPAEKGAAAPPSRRRAGDRLPRRDRGGVRRRTGRGGRGVAAAGDGRRDGPVDRARTGGRGGQRGAELGGVIPLIGRCGDGRWALLTRRHGDTERDGLGAPTRGAPTTCPRDQGVVRRGSTFRPMIWFHRSHLACPSTKTMISPSLCRAQSPGFG